MSNRASIAASIDHYENFPVASLLLPAPLRLPVRAIYRFARLADDIVDEGSAGPDERLIGLDDLRRQLDAISHGEQPSTALFQVLADVIRDHNLPLDLFHDLLDAFAQDVQKQRYANFSEVMNYCRRSANPIGRLLLHLFKQTDGLDMQRSDQVCSSLQLINFLQDVESDYRRGRIYLPMNELDEFGVTEVQIAQGKITDSWRKLMQHQIERTSCMLEAGAPLGRTLTGRIGLEIRTIIAGGRCILRKLDRVQGDVFRHRPVLRAWDWPPLVMRAALNLSHTP